MGTGCSSCLAARAPRPSRGDPVLKERVQNALGLQDLAVEVAGSDGEIIMIIITIIIIIIIIIIVIIIIILIITRRRRITIIIVIVIVIVIIFIITIIAIATQGAGQTRTHDAVPKERVQNALGTLHDTR